jgi:two-component system, LytTR family, response regulator
MPLRTLIVDDEQVARKILREELEMIGDVEIVGEADNGAAALDQITLHEPDLVLLDLQMPVMGGLDVVRRLKHAKRVPAIVIVTAYDQFAIHAFEAGAIDYLLKPISQERLADAVGRAKRMNARETAERVARIHDIAEPAAVTRSRKIVGRAGEEYILLSTDEVYAFQAAGDVVWIITAKNKYLATQSLKVLQERLRDTSFRRFHRSALVNIDHVHKMITLSSQRWLVTLSNNMEFIVSKRQARIVRQLLNY